MWRNEMKGLKKDKINVQTLIQFRRWNVDFSIGIAKITHLDYISFHCNIK